MKQIARTVIAAPKKTNKEFLHSGKELDLHVVANTNISVKNFRVVEQASLQSYAFRPLTQSRPAL